MYCPNCGKEIGNSNSCPKCGWKDRTPAKPKKKPGCLIGLLVFFGIAFFVFVSSMSYENPSTLEDAYLRIDQEQAKTELWTIIWKLLGTSPLGIPSSGSDIVSMPKIMSLKIGSPGVLAVTILTRRISPLVKWRTGVCNVTGGTEKLPQLSI